jgi:biuret amidohydrolase
MPAALVLLDLQHGILSSPAVAWENPRTPAMVTATADELLRAGRAARLLVVHAGVVRAQARGALDEIRTSAAHKSGRAPRDVLAMAAGTRDVEFALAPVAGEEIVHKMGVSAFAGTRLDLLLHSVGVRDVFIGGVFTHMVVESTARQGFDLGYRMHVVSDACAAPATAPHQNALATGIPNFAVVLNVGDAVAAMVKA